MLIDCKQAKNRFLSYVEAYDATNPRIALKIEHSLRVAELCREIAKREHFSKTDCDLAWLIGLLHDIGRFEQLRRWNTFSDTKSASHAALSIEVLFEEKPNEAPYTDDIRLRAFITDDAEDELIYQAIALHSVLDLPEDLTDRQHAFCSLVRDADKLDILDTMQYSTPETIMNSTLEELQVSKLSPAVINAFKEHRCVKREERLYPADYVVGFLCFVFELEYTASKTIASESGSALSLVEHPFGMKDAFINPDTQEAFKCMKQELNTWLDLAV